MLNDLGNTDWIRETEFPDCEIDIFQIDGIKSYHRFDVHVDRFTSDLDSPNAIFYLQQLKIQKTKLSARR